MGKIPSRIEFDEDGLPIPQTVKTTKIQFDSDGLPIPVKKKEGSGLSMVGGKAVQPPSQSGGQVGSSAPQSERDKIADFVKTLGGKPTVTKTQPNVPAKQEAGKAITQIKTAKKPETTFDQTVEEAVTGGVKKINEIMYDTNDDWQDPLKVTLEKSADRTKGNKENLDYLAANVLTRDAILKSGYNASKMLETTPIWAMAKIGENMTADLLKQKKAEFDIKVEPFKVIQLDKQDNGSGVGDDEFYKYIYGDRIYDAAIKAHAAKNPNFKDQLLAKGATYQDFENNDLAKFVPQGKLGQIVSETIYDPDVIEYIKNDQPYLLPAIKSVANSLIEDDKTFGANVVANKVSKEYLKRKPVTGLRQVANFATQGMKDELNQVAKDVLTEQEYNVYHQKILGNEENYIDTPSMLEGFARGGKNIFNGIKSTFTTPFKSTDEVITKQWEDEASNVSADPKGMLKFLTDSGHTLGIVAGIGATGNVLGGGGVGFYSTKIVPALSGAIPFLGDMLQEGTAKYPNSPVKAWTSAIFNTALYSALSYQIFPAKQIERIFKGVKPEVSKVVENLASGSITKEAARQEMNTIALQTLDLISGAGVKSANISGELTGITALNQMLDKAMGMDDKTYEKYHPEGELSESFNSLFLSNLFVGGLAKFGEMKNGNRIVEASLYDAASNPLKYQREIQLLKTKDETIDEGNLSENLNFVTSIKKQLDERGIKPENQGRYLFEAIKEKVFSDAIKSTPDANLTRRFSLGIERGQEVKDRILNGEDVVANENFEIQKKNGGLSEEQKAIKSAIDNGDIKDEMYKGMAEMALKDPETAKQFIDEIKSQAVGDVSGELGNARKGVENTWGKELVDYAAGTKEQISQPIELDPNLPEGFEGQPKVEYDENGNQIIPDNTQSSIKKQPKTGSVGVEGKIEKRFTAEGGNKIVDEKTGNPIEVFHGTNAPFESFDKGKLGTKNFMAESAQEGFFFAGNKKTSEAYIGINSGDVMGLNISGSKHLESINEKYKIEEDAIKSKKQKIWEEEQAKFDKKFKESGILDILNKDGKLTDKQIERLKHIDPNWSKWQDEAAKRYEEEGLLKAQEELNQRKLNDLEQLYFKDKGLSRRIVSAHLDMKNPYIFDYDGGEGTTEGLTSHIKKAKKEGHDGVIFKNLADGGEKDTIYVVFEPKQIKITNKNILEQPQSGIKEAATKGTIPEQVHPEVSESKIFDEIEQADRSKIQKKAKLDAVELAAKKYGEAGKKAAEIHNKFEDIVKELIKNKKIERIC